MLGLRSDLWTRQDIEKRKIRRREKKKRRKPETGHHLFLS